jgi:hypothetical protein
VGELFISSGITMKKPLTYDARLRNMKASVEIMKGELLSEDGFPDDVSYLGSPYLVHMNEEKNQEHVDLPENTAGGKSGKNN